MGQIHGLRGQVVTDGRTPDQQVVKHVRDLLAMVESGEVIGLHAVWCYHDGGTNQLSVGATSYASIGRVVRLQRKMIDDFMTFTIRHKPDGKWSLLKGDVPIFMDFESRKEAEAGMLRAIKPVIFIYDEEGKLIDAVPRG